MFSNKEDQAAAERLKKALEIKGVTQEYLILSEGDPIIGIEPLCLRKNKDGSWDVSYSERGKEKILGKFYSSTYAQLYFFWLLQDLESPWDVVPPE